MNLPVRLRSSAFVFALVGCLISTAEAQAPVPEITFERSYSSNSIVYISSVTPVAISILGDGIGTTIYYILDADPELSTPSVYSQTFTLSEGAHALYTRAVQADVPSEPSSAAIHVDATAPHTALRVTGLEDAAPGPDGYIHIGPYSGIVLLSTDPVSNGVVSGVETTYYLIDREPAACEGTPRDTDTVHGTCANPLYAGPFSLSPGTHTVYYMSVDNAGNEENLSSVPIYVGGEGTLSGVISTPGLPAGSTVTVVVSTGYFRNEAFTAFTFGAQDPGIDYTLTLPAFATYYILAFAGIPENGPPPGTPIGVYGNYTPVYLASGAAVSGINFQITPDAQPPFAAITSIVEGSTITGLSAISGTAADNIGVNSLEAAVQDITTGLWWRTADNMWVSPGIVPPFAYADAVFQGAPDAGTWSTPADRDYGGTLGLLSTHLAVSHNYTIHLRAKDFTGNMQQLPATVTFTWNGLQGLVAPSPVNGLSGSALGISSVSWTWQEAANVSGYAVYSDPGVFLSSVTAPPFISTGLAPNSPLSIWVAAYNVYAESIRNRAAEVYTLAAVPGVPEIISVSSYSFAIKWNADSNPPGTPHELDISTDDFQSGSSTSVPVGSGVGNMYHTLPGLSAATTYYLRLRAINGDSIPSAYSASLSVKTFDPPPPVPGSLAATYDPATVKLAVFWFPAGGVPAASYNIYRAVEPDPDVFNTVGTSTATYYEDTYPQSTTYYYSVSALNSEGVESPRSEPPLEVVVDITPPEAIANLKVSSYSAANGSAVLTWTAPNDNTALGRYLIKAGVEPVLDYNWNDAVVIGTTSAIVPIGAAQSYGITVYSTETLKFFAVKALDAAGNASPVSNSAVLDLLPPEVAVTTSSIQPDVPVTRPFSTYIEAWDNHLISRVDFLVDSVVAGSAPVRAQTYTSDFIWDIGAYPDGNHMFHVRTYDQYGNVDEKQFPALINYVPPAAPAISLPLNNFSIHASTIDVSGTAETGTYISLFVNDAFVTSVEATTAGTFYAAAVQLGGDGAVSITAQAVDAHGASPRSAAVSGVVDSGPPGAPVSFVSQPSAYGKVALAWSAPTGEKPASYNIYRSALETALVEGGAPSGPLLVAGGITELEFTDIPSQDGVYYYAAASVDAAQNISVLSNVEAVLSDSLAPTAAIALPGKTPPLGAGSYRLEAAVTEVLSAPPYLVFTPPGAYPAQIVLVSSSPYIWVGTLTVTQAMASGTGSFTFQGSDLTGNAGNTITAGSALELQTEGPVASISFNPQAGPALKAGSYTVELALSHNEVSAPEFTYSIASGSRAVALSSSGNVWSGLITVDAETGEGVHNFSYSAVDSLGNTGTLLSGATYFIADTMATGAPVSLNPSIGAAGVINLSWSSPLGEKPAHYCVYRDNIQLVCSVTPETEYYTGAYSETPSAGTHEYYISALDRAGNESQPSLSAQVSSDNTPPAAPQGLSAVVEGTAINLSWSAGEGETPTWFRLYRATYTITSTQGLTPITLVGSSAVNMPSRDGIYHYAMSAVDLPGNESALSPDVWVSYDAAAPEITISGVEDGNYYSGAVRPAFEAFDLNLAASSALLNGSAFVSGSAVTAPDSYALRVDASDALGHAALKTVNFTIDKTSPAITLSGIAAGGVYTSTITPAISASDAHLSTVTALLNGSPYAIGSVIIQSGNYTLEITAADLAGNTAVYSAAFSLDLPPQKLQSLTAVIEEGSVLALSWAAYAGEVSVYKVFRDGLYLAPVSASGTSFRDTAYTAAAHIYEVAAVDSKGREGARARAELPAVSFALAGYGNYAGAEQALNRGFFDAVRFTVANKGAQAVQAGPVSLAVGAEAPVSALSASVAAGSSVEISPVIYTSTSSAGSVAGRAVLALPQGGDAAVSAVTNFTMAVRDPLQPIVEIYPEALVRGAYAKVKVKFNNRGSAPADIVTAKLVNNAAAPSPAVAVELKTSAGFVLSRGELQQTTGTNIAFVNGTQVYFVEVPAGGSLIFEPVRVAVPETAAQALNVEGIVSGFASSLAYAPRYSGAEFNASKSMATELAIPYTATLYSDKPAYNAETTVKIAGKFQDIWGNLLAGFPLTVTLSNKGYNKNFTVLTDSAAMFNLDFIPASGEAGVFDISVRHPDFVGEAAHSSFTVMGMKYGWTEYTLTMAQGSSYAFDAEFFNTGETPLEGLSSAFTQFSGSGVSAALTGLPSALGAGLNSKFQVTLTAQAGSSATAEFVLHISESNGFERTLPIHVKTVPAQVIPKITPQVFEIGLLAGGSRTQLITVENIGFSTWTGVNISLPTLPWVKVDGLQGLMKSLGDIPPGGNASFTLQIAPPDTLPNQAYAQNPLVELISANFAAVAINAGITVTSSKYANVFFNVTNADKLPLDATRFIGGAAVTLTSLDIYGLKLTAKTDANGYTALQSVPSGKYAYRVEAGGAQPTSGVIELEPGLDKTLNVLLPTSMVTYKWSVTPTSITDKYDITLDMTFRTDVPAPALVISPPLISLAMEGGQTLYTQYTVENKGLVSAYDFELSPQNTDAVTIELPFTTISEIKPGQLIVVPVKITLAHASCNEAGVNHKAKFTCAAGTPIGIAVEPTKFLLGNSCPTGGGGGGGGGGGWAQPLQFSGSAANIAAINADVVTPSGCGQGCIEGTTAGCDPCKRCVGGECWPDSSQDGQSCGKASNICQKMECQAGSCVAKDNSAETNAKVSGGLLSMANCPNRVPKDGYIPQTNGCGSDGFNVPDAVGACVSIKDACDVHDKCYGTCNQSGKLACDAALGVGIAKICLTSMLSGECLSSCLATASTYSTFVALGGGRAYNKGQTESCDRCCP